jgi:hypothetical protein
VKTADTGQIDWATVLRPGPSQGAGYEIWRFIDSSIFLKIEYGTHTISTTSIQVWLTFGTGSNGSGTLTGTVSDRRTASRDISFSSPTNTNHLASYSSEKGFFAFAAFRESNSYNSFFAVARTTDSNGAPNGIGATGYWRINGTGNFSVQALNFQTNTTRATHGSGKYSFVPHSLLITHTGSDQQAFSHWTAMPRVHQVPQIMTVLANEFPTNATFQTVPIGSQLWNYIALNPDTGRGEDGNSFSSIAILWE